jgi:hypothetical protein
MALKNISTFWTSARSRLSYCPPAVATALLDRQLAAQAAAFEREGGFTERL